MPRLFARSLLLLGLAVCLMPAACAQPSAVPTPPPAASPTPALEFRVVGYVTEAVIVAAVPFDRLTHINYAFLIPNADGTVDPILNSWKLDQLVAEAHAQGVKVLISVGGWGWDTQFETLAADPALRAVFVREVTAFAARHNLDGVDMDWEYPDAGPSAQNFLALMRELRAALPAGQLLTAAVVAYGANGEGIPAEAFELMDFVNLMAYDGPDHGTLEQAEKSLDYWAGRGLPPEKTVLGVPFYGDPNMPYRKLVQADPAAAQADTTTYLGAEYHYNGIPTIQRKAHLARERASGLMIWTIEFDTLDEYSLLSAIQEALGK